MNAILSERNVLRAVKKILGVAGLAALALFYAGPTRAQTKPTERETAASTSVAVPGIPPSEPPASAATSAQVETVKTVKTISQNTSTKPPAPRGQAEGLKVHGHWIIEIHNPDGKVVTRSEFENSISVGGSALLLDLLARKITGGAWSIQLGQSGSGLCDNPTLGAGFTTDCFVAENATSVVSGCSPSLACFPNLTLQTSAGTLQNLTGTSPPTLTLSGTATAGSAATSVMTVSTNLTTCPTTNLPSTCAVTANSALPPDEGGGFFGGEAGKYGTTNRFTSAPLSTAANCGTTGQPPCAVPVAPGQIILATVVISFQ
jgi:hypothetical protein